jgi:rhodanese-related sulfurtransferase
MKKRLFIEGLLIFLVVGMLTTFARPADVPRMTVDELKAMLGSPDLVIIDVRGSGDWKDSDVKIKAAVREDPVAVETWAKKYPKDKTLVLYCA